MIRRPYILAILLLIIFPTEMGTNALQKSFMRMFIFFSSQRLERTPKPISSITKLGYVFIQWILNSNKKTELLPHAIIHMHFTNSTLDQRKDWRINTDLVYMKFKIE